MSTGSIGPPSRPRLPPASGQARALAAVAEALARAGDVDRAEAIARSITDPYWAGTRRWLVWRGHWPGRVMSDRAEAIARSITDPSGQARGAGGCGGGTGRGR